MWVLIVIVVVALMLVARPLVAIHRSSIPTIVRALDAASATAFNDDERSMLVARGFKHDSVSLVDISGVEAVLHLYRRAQDATVATGLSAVGGSAPSHYITTMLGGGNGWLDSRTTDRTPGPRGEFVQVSPGASLAQLLADHETALDAMVSLGAVPSTQFDAIGMHLHRGAISRSSLERNPIRWCLGLATRSFRPDRPHVVATDPDLPKRMQTLGLIPAGAENPSG
jgi:hypothetical protein